MHRPTSSPLARLAAVASLASAAACATPSAAADAPGGPAPQSTAYSTTGVLLVANQQSANASIVNLASGEVTTIPVGTGPHEAAISPDGRWGVVTVYGTQTPGNRLAIVDMSRRAVARTIDLGQYTRPHDVAFLPGSSSSVVVTSEATQRVVLVNIAAGTVGPAIETRANGSHMLSLTADGRRLFTANVGSGSASEIDLAGRAFVWNLPVGQPQTEGVAVTPDGREVWLGSNQAGSVSVIDTRTGTVAATIPGLGLPYRIAISADGKTAAIPDPQNGRVHVLDVAARRLVGSLEGLGSPRGVDIAPDNRTAYVTLGGPGSEVAVVDLTARTVLRRFTVGSAPDGVGWGPAAP